MITQPFFHSEDQVKQEALRFLSLIYSIYEFDSYYVFGDPRDTFYEMQWYANDELSRSIVSLASLGRVNDDGGDGLKLHKDRFPDGVGTLIESGVKRPLTAREACNKIIHATNANWQFKHSSKHPILGPIFNKKGIHHRFKIKRPMLELEGTLHKIPWQARVDIIQWVHAILRFSPSNAKTP